MPAVVAVFAESHYVLFRAVYQLSIPKVMAV
jgi:hypothetical protein